MLMISKNCSLQKRLCTVSLLTYSYYNLDLDFSFVGSKKKIFWYL